MRTPDESSLFHSPNIASHMRAVEKRESEEEARGMILTALETRNGQKTMFSKQYNVETTG